MARNSRTAADVRSEIAAEREQLAQAVDDLKKGIDDVTDVQGKLRSNLPIAAAGAAGIGFFLAGGIGATMRLLFRRGRER
jgi:ABC-type transporter Mla subunit MlaD